MVYSLFNIIIDNKSRLSRDILITSNIRKTSLYNILLVEIIVN